MSRFITASGFLSHRIVVTCRNWHPPTLTGEDIQQAIGRDLIGGAPCPLATHLHIMGVRKAMLAGLNATDRNRRKDGTDDVRGRDYQMRARCIGSKLADRDPHAPETWATGWEPDSWRTYITDETLDRAVVRVQSEPDIWMLEQGIMPPLSEATDIPGCIRQASYADLILHILGH